ncbi:nucleolar protein 12-domain-containing protein, partial [Thermothelomyces heterothallicus CBS 202.75]|uniref:nucleolar protein 12-domain-containing protein n=1 Tax=Thermothelomyces heterothallicus CBS 202.75 TaxID=1149848 RepID=UPI003743BECA
MFAQPRIRKTAPPPPKKRKISHAIEEITFDKAARAEYLTGFRKRKQARIRHAQEIAEQKAREERIAIRKQIREERKKAVEDHVQAINKILREAEYAGTADQNEKDSEDEWGGFSDNDIAEPPIDVEEEYIDEDKYTTVTVEAVNVDRDGLHKPELGHPSDGEESGKEEGSAEQNLQKDEVKRPKEPKKKKKKFRYGNKIERELEARKQRAKRRK